MKSKTLFLFLLLLMTATTGWAVTPMDYYNTLVAGGSERGYRDGTFISAYFNNPAGIAFDETGEKLFVADSANNRIRIVDLANNNRVETLAGTGTGGSVDGPLDKTSFAAPLRVTTLPDDRLAVYDAGDNLIRLIEVKKRTVSTIAHGLIIWNMVYRPQDDSLYFSQPDNKSVSKLDLKTLTISPVFSNNPQIPAPMALCVAGDKFYVSDRDSSKVYEMNGMGGKLPEFKEIGKGENIIELAFTDNQLYALQIGKIPLVRVGFPTSTPVHLATAWGFFADSDQAGVEPFSGVLSGQVYGFAASPKEPRKFYITKTNIGGNAIISVKDYDFGSSVTGSSKKSSNGLTDFNYPARKPERTFRILIMGDSRTTSAIRSVTDVGDKADKGLGTYRTDTFPKQLEFFLNADGNMGNVGTHFEVLTFSQPDKSLSSYASNEVAALVKKYDLDLVLGLTDEAGVKKGAVDSTVSNLKTLSKKIQELKLTDGSSPKLDFLYVPLPAFNNDESERGWKALCSMNGFSLIDLSEAFDGLKMSYYPTCQKKVNAYTAYGSELVANILSRYLERNQLIPFEESKK